MGFLPLEDIIKYKNNKSVPKIGTVLNNKDPQKLGRVKVSLPGMFDPEDEIGSNLPWIRKMTDSFLVGGEDTESFSVPDIGATVEIVWPYDKETAFYKGCPYSKETSTGSFTENYPYESGFRIGELIIKFDKGTKAIFISNNRGFNIVADATGEVIVSATSLTLESDMDLNIDAPNVNIEGSLSVSGGIQCSQGASGTISMANIASVSNGMITSIE